MTRKARTLIVGNERGVHGRVATALAEIAERHQVRLSINKGTEGADCSSILDVLALALVQGTQLQVEAEGFQAEEALQAVERLLTAKEDPQ